MKGWEHFGYPCQKSMVPLSKKYGTWYPCQKSVVPLSKKYGTWHLVKKVWYMVPLSKKYGTLVKKVWCPCEKSMVPKVEDVCTLPFKVQINIMGQNKHQSITQSKWSSVNEQMIATQKRKEKLISTVHTCIPSKQSKMSQQKA